MAVNRKKTKDVSRTLRDTAKTYVFRDQGLLNIIKDAANPYQMLQAINYSGRLNNTESLIMSRVFLHVDAVAKLADKNKAEDEIEALVAAFKCLLNTMKDRENSTGSLFVDNAKDNAEWVMIDNEESDEFVMIEQDIGT